MQFIPVVTQKMDIGKSRIQKIDKLEKLVILLVIAGHGHLFNFLLHHGGLLTDIDTIQELPDVLLPDPGGLLNQGR